MAITWFVLGAILGGGAEADEGIQNQLVGLGGLGALAAGTAVEAALALKKRVRSKSAACAASHQAMRAWGRKRPYSYVKDPQKFLLVAELLTSMAKRDIPALPEGNPAGVGPA